MRGNEKQFKETRLIIVLLAVIIVLLFGIIILLLARGDKPNPVLEPNKVEKKEEQKKEEQSNKDEKTDEPISKTNEKGSLNSDIKSGEKDSKTIKLNNKEIEISYEDEEEEYGPGTRYLKVNNKEIGKWTPGGIDEIEYETFTSIDGKEYLVLSYRMWGHYTYIIDENANIIKSVDELAKLKDGNDCFIINETKLNEIEGNYFYYYRYNSGEIVNGNNYESKLKIEQIKVTINNSRVSEESTGKIIESTFGQCN